MAIRDDTFLRAIGSTAMAMPVHGYLLAAGAGALQALCELAHWTIGRGITGSHFLTLVATLAIHFAAIYFVVAPMLGLVRSRAGCIKFLGAGGGASSVLLVWLYPMAYGPEAVWSSATIMLVLAALALVGFVFHALLTAWPVAQSQAERLVHPLDIIRATKGHRGALIGFMVAIYALASAGYVNFHIPSAHGTDQLVLRTAGLGVAYAVVVYGSALVTTAAWALARKRMPLGDATRSVSA